MSGKFKGLFDALTGFLLGAGTLKIYYETVDSEKHRESFIFRQDKQKINEICTTHENLKFGKDKRLIKGHVFKNIEEQGPDLSHGILKFGQPQGSLEILYYTNHVVGYDYAKKIPLWVAEHLTKDKIMASLDPSADRNKSRFLPDANIPEIFQAKNEDYYKSGWTRGHMAPAGDNKHDQESMNETFLLSNIVPQNYDNNTNFWYRMEVFCRNLTKQFRDVYVISGPLWLPHEKNGKKFVSYEVIGKNNVAVPTHLFKAIVAVDKKEMVFFGAFEIPNKPIPYERKLSDFQVPLSKLEKDSGLHLLQTINQSRTRDLCEITGCELLSKEVMENVMLRRQLQNTQNLEQLDTVWSEVNNKSICKDNSLNSLYQKKREEFDQYQSVEKNTVDGS